MREIRKLLVATDFSPHSERALECALALAKAFGAPIHLLHAFALPIPFVTPYEVAIPDRYLEQAREQALRRLEACEAALKAAGVEVHAHLTEVPAAPSIARAAKELEIDLIVMGTRGNTGLKHALLGSVTDRTLRLAPCSVLAVKEPEGS